MLWYHRVLCSEGGALVSVGIEAEAGWMCLRLCEHHFPFLLPVLTVEVLTGGQLLQII